MYVLKNSISMLWVHSTFISLLQIVADVQERSCVEGLSKVARFSIGRNEACKPVISYAHRWYHGAFAAILEASFAEDCEHPNLLVSLKIRIWFREYLMVV